MPRLSACLFIAWRYPPPFRARILLLWPFSLVTRGDGGMNGICGRRWRADVVCAAPAGRGGRRSRLGAARPGATRPSTSSVAGPPLRCGRLSSAVTDLQSQSCRCACPRRASLVARRRPPRPAGSVCGFGQCLEAAMGQVLKVRNGGTGRKSREGLARAEARAGSAEPRASLYDEVTARIVAELEAGRFPWVQPWDSVRLPPPACRATR